MIALTLVLSMLAVVSNMFSSNTKYVSEDGKYISEYNKFAMYFISDIKNNSETYSVTNNEIVFEDGTVYTYKPEPDYGIYRNKVKICSNITFCNFEEIQKIEEKMEKKIIKVNMSIRSSKTFQIENEYVLKYW